MITLTIDLSDPGDKRREALEVATAALLAAGFNPFRSKADSGDGISLAREGDSE